MRRKKKRNVLPPRRLRMKRCGRLASARHWMPTYEGKNIVRGYARWFGVDHLCAVKELRILGVTVDPAYVAMLECTARNKGVARAKARARREAEAEASRRACIDQDENYYFIAGYTGWGFPYGITWEEHEALEAGRVLQVKLRDGEEPF